MLRVISVDDCHTPFSFGYRVRYREDTIVSFLRVANGPKFDWIGMHRTPVGHRPNSCPLAPFVSPGKLIHLEARQRNI